MDCLCQVCSGSEAGSAPGLGLWTLQQHEEACCQPGWALRRGSPLHQAPAVSISWAGGQGLEVLEVFATCSLLSSVAFFALRWAGERWQPAPAPASRGGGQDPGARGGETGSSHPVPYQRSPCCAEERVIDKQVSAVKEKCCSAL